MPLDFMARRDRIAALCAAYGIEMKAAALYSSAAPEVVACGIPGGRSAAEVAENARLTGRTIPAAFRAELRSQSSVPASAPVPG